VSAPALTMNGISYNGLGTGGGLIFSLCQSGLEPIPSPGLDACATGANDVYFFLVTVYDMPSGQSGSILPETKITIYTAGNPTSQSGDHYSMVSQVLDAISGQSFSGYEIDGYGPALLAPASGAPAPYTLASPLIAQQQVCSIRSGSPAYLRWDADQQAYIGSYTPLSFGGEVYDGMVIWGMEQFEDEPNVIAAEMREKPIWWADGMESVSAGVISIPTEQQTIKATVFAPLALFTQLETMGIPVQALAADALVAPADPQGVNTPGIPEDDHYTWNQSALAAAGITLAPTHICSSGSYQMIGSTTADPEGNFAAQVSPFDTPGDHHIFARSYDLETGSMISESHSEIYHLVVFGDITPPEASSIIVSNSFISPTNPSSVGVNDYLRISADISDESGYEWFITVRNRDTKEIVFRRTGSNTPIEVIWNGEYDQEYSDAGYYAHGAILAQLEGGTSLDIVPDGTYELIIKAIDQSPNANVLEIIREVFKDDTTPEVSFLDLVNGDIIRDPWSLIKIIATDNFDIDSVAFSYDENPSTLINDRSGNVFNILWIIPEQPTYTTRTLRARATDLAGNVLIAEITIGIDLRNDFPTINIVSPSDGDYIRLTRQFNVLFRNEAHAPIDNIKLLFNDSPDFTYSPSANDNFYAFEVDTTIYPDGLYAVSAVLSRTTGANISTGPIYVFIDNTPPEIVPPVIPADGYTLDDKAVPIEVRVTDFATGSGIDIPQTTLEITRFRPALPDATQYPNNEVVFKYPIMLIDGEYNAKINFQDLAGNESEYEWSFNVDTSGLIEAFVPDFIHDKVIVAEGKEIRNVLETEGNPLEVMYHHRYYPAVASVAGQDRIQGYTWVNYGIGFEVSGDKKVGDMPVSNVVTPDLRTMVVSSGLTDTMAAVDMTSGQTIYDVNIGLSPSKMAMSANGREVYVAIQGEDRVAVFDPRSATQTASIPMLPGSRPKAVAINPASDEFLFVANTELDAITAVYLRAEQPEAHATFSTCSKPIDIESDPQGRYLWVVCAQDNRVEIYDMSNLNRVESLDIFEPYAIDFSANGQHAYVRSISPNAITAISVSEMRIIGKLRY